MRRIDEIIIHCSDSPEWRNDKVEDIQEGRTQEPIPLFFYIVITEWRLSPSYWRELFETSRICHSGDGLQFDPCAPYSCLSPVR